MSTIPFAAQSLHDRIRPAMFAGSSYPSNPEHLATLLDAALLGAADTVNADTLLLSENSIPERERQRARAIVAPHIDFRVGLSCYAPAYYALQQSDAEIFVIIATSHYGWQDLFIPTFQHFSTPLGVVRTDTEIVSTLYNRLPYSLTRNDTAHREEHSIEFEVVWLQHLFGRTTGQTISQARRPRDFSIVPILVTSFHPFVESRTAPARTAKFAQFVATLDSVLRDSGKKVAWVASGDMAHIGRKFDDDYDAEPVLPELAGEDEALMRVMEQCDAESYFRLIAEVGDARKICGLPPVYTMLEAMKLSENAGVKPFVGKALAYEQWSERPTRSAVSYSSVAYW